MAKLSRRNFNKIITVSSVALAQGKKILFADRKKNNELMKRLKDPRLLSRGSTRVYSKEHLSALSFPVGGNGAGCIQINGKAELYRWQIFNNQSQSRIPHSFFAVSAKSDNKKSVVRALQTIAKGPFEAMKSLSFRGEYPFGRFDFKDPELPVEVSMEVFNPFIPLNARDSGIPCAIFNISVKNRSKKPTDISLLASQQNAIGFKHRASVSGRKWREYGGNSNRILKEKENTILHMTSSKKKDDPLYGDMTLSVFENTVTGTASWESMDSLKKEWSKDGALKGVQKAGPSSRTETIDGALAFSFNLKSGETRLVRFALTWHFPNAIHGKEKLMPGRIKKFGHKPWVHKGNMYQNWYADALEVARDISIRLDDLTRLTRLYHDTFYMTSLPYWLLDRINSQAAVLRSKTCFWAKDHYFGAWEGSGGACGTDEGGGCCYGNCTHVLQYAQMHARLFPKIAKLMRKGSFDSQFKHGGIPFRHPTGRIACDGHLGEILGAYREHLMSTDGKWLHENWPKIRNAMEYGIKAWDDDEDGVLSGPQHNTLDAMLGGSSTWHGSLYLAALAACEKMAIHEGEQKTARRYGDILRSGAKKQNEALWNGEYFIQKTDDLFAKYPKSKKDYFIMIPEGTPLKNYLTGCGIDQMLGQWWANQLGLGWIYPQERVRKAMQSLVKYNFKPDFHGIQQAPRKFVSDNDAGMQMFSWPKGGRPRDKKHCVGYADEVMSGFEYAAASTMVQSGLINEGFMVVLAASDRYDGRLRMDVSEKGAKGCSGNPFGDDECGKFYFRALSIWSMLLACQGFIYDGPAEKIGFRPVWSPKDHSSFFTASEGWGLFIQKRAGKSQTEQIEIKYGKLKVRELLFEFPEKVKPGKVALLLDKKKIPMKFIFNKSQLLVTLEEPITLKTDSILKVNIEFKL